MKIIRLVNSIAFLLVFTGILSGQPISLITCIDSSLASKGTLKSKITDVEIAKLETSAAWQRYLPDLSVSYNYRYNPLIPTQIIPVGQFSPVPTDEKRPIKFGTTWQQNAGVSIYQPIIDFTLSNRVRESRINEKIRSADAEAAGRELVTEVLKSYTNIWLYQERLQAAALDTLRTYRTRELIKARWDEGKALRADINRAVMNHNNALSGYHEVNSSLAGEKIYLSYLTGLPLVVLVNGPYDFSPFTDGMIEASLAGPVSDSIPSVEILKLRKELFE
ncbi:MAG: TolC family protein, partial [Bacteroidales bacterium]|nr:TolC family protein [Bacteroidales bacterium]